MLTVHTTPTRNITYTRAQIVSAREELLMAYAGGDLRFPVRTDVYDMRMRQLTSALRRGDSPYYKPTPVSADTIMRSALGYVGGFVTRLI